MSLLYTVLIMLLVVGGTRLTAQFVPVPLPLIQILAGCLLALPAFGLHVKLDPELFLVLFVPPLLFSDGWRMPKREFWRLRTPILTLAFGLVLFTVFGAGGFIHWLLGLPWPVAFALAAVLSPTDAVAVAAITHGRLPRTVNHVLQGEALMNDASGLVAFKFAVAAALTGLFSLGGSSLSFLLVAIGGLGVGVALSWLLGRMRAWFIGRGWDDPATHVVLLLLLPFAAYVLADRLGTSGILSAVAAGMMQSRLDLLPRQTTTRLLNHSVWAMLDYAFNGLVFLLLGLQLPDIVEAVLKGAERPWLTSLQLLGYVLAIFVVLMSLRFLWTYSYWKLAAQIRQWRGRPATYDGQSAWRLTALMSLSGVRGAVTLAGVMSLPLLIEDKVPFPKRDLLIFMAAGVILISLLMACISLPFLLRGLPKEDGQNREEERLRLWRKTAEAAIRELEMQGDDMGEDAELAALASETKARIMAEYRSQLSEHDGGSLDREQARLLKAYDARLRLLALRAQRLELYRLRREHLLDDEIVTGLLRELDIREAQLAER